MYIVIIIFMHIKERQYSNNFTTCATPFCVLAYSRVHLLSEEISRSRKKRKIICRAKKTFKNGFMSVFFLSSSHFFFVIYQTLLIVSGPRTRMITIKPKVGDDEEEKKTEIEDKKTSSKQRHTIITLSYLIWIKLCKLYPLLRI
jgi:hypothetical protein